MSPAPDRHEVVTLLASYGDRAPSAVPEDIDSLELAWLVHQVEQRYRVALDLDDDELARMTTVTGAVDVLADVLPAAEAAARSTDHGAPAG